MNSKDNTSEQDGGPDPSQSYSSQSELIVEGCANPEPWCASGPDTMKRQLAKQKIERYFYQLVDGCGDPNCGNEYCASSGKVKNLTRNQAAAQAFQLFSKEAKLCETLPAKVPRTQLSPEGSSRPAPASANTFSLSEPCNSRLHDAAPEKRDKPPDQAKEIPVVTEESLVQIIRECKEEESFSKLIRTLGEVYSRPESLARSFIRVQPESPIDIMLEKAGKKDLANLKKEDVRELEGDLDKDEDCKEEDEIKESGGRNSQGESKSDGEISDEITLDIASLRRAYEQLFQLPVKTFEGALVNAIVALMDVLELDLKMKKDQNESDLANLFVIIIEIPFTCCSEFIDVALPHICKTAAQLSVACQAKVVKVWARHCKNRLKPLLDCLQQLITLKVMTGFTGISRDYNIQDEVAVTAPTKLVKMIYYASLIAGDMDSPDLRREDPTPIPDDSILGGSPKTEFRMTKSLPVDPLETLLKLNVLDSRQPLIPFEDFYNEPLSDSVEMDKDFTNYKSELTSRKFSFMNYPFILTPATKTLGLYYDNRIRMYSERRISFFQTAVGQPTNPYLKLKVRREQIIADALVELELIAMENPKDLKKQLVVEFEGEQGIDEGGVSKEFFQLVVEEIFNPDYGMFVHQPETETVWFNPTSFESDAQFTLIGIVLGLAIYNNVILDVRFPMVLYKKLMGKRGTFYDLQDWNPTLFSGLKSLLEHAGEDVEDVFGVSYKICYTDVFGTALFHDLKEGGDKLLVNQYNREEYVDLYADFLLNRCIEKQFRAFRRGFQMVTDESPLGMLFRPEEVEMLVCGSKNFDFNELEEATEYDGGYTAETPIVQEFWALVHAMPLEDKRKLLQFATGSDRVPVGGLSRLKLIIAKNGPDSDRLPTAHTCFNVLLLPEYSSRSKLQDRLEKAINYSKGFGML